VSSYQVSWKDPSASDDDFDVFVNAGSGAVFAFLDRRQGVGLVAPLMGQTAATNLATAAIRAPATLWSTATLTLGFDSDSTGVSPTAFRTRARAPPIRRRGTTFGRGSTRSRGRCRGSRPTSRALPRAIG
jgi:hypothetical protein